MSYCFGAFVKSNFFPLYDTFMYMYMQFVLYYWALYVTAHVAPLAHRNSQGYSDMSEIHGLLFTNVHTILQRNAQIKVLVLTSKFE